MSADDKSTRVARGIVGPLALCASMTGEVMNLAIAEIADALRAARAEGIREGRAQAVAEIRARATSERLEADWEVAAAQDGSWHLHANAAEVLGEVADRIEALTSTDAATTNTR